MAGTNVTFNGTSIQTASVLVSRVQHRDIPRKKRDVFMLARTNRSKRTNVVYPEKVIVVNGRIIGTSIPDLDSKVDAFKLAMTPGTESANLDIDYNGTTRRYVSEAPIITIPEGEALFAVEFTLEFLCLSPFGIDLSTTTLLNTTANTGATTNAALTIGGTAPEQYPTISYTLTAFTGSAIQTITFLNVTTGQQITVSRTWVANDVVVIDTNPEALSVKVNGTETDYGGVFPVFSSGSHTLRVTDGFTTRSFNLNIIHTKQYL